MITLSNNSYEVIAIGIMAAFFAQVIKFCIFIIKSRRINFKIFTTTGGMPSSHSAGVMGLSTSVGLIAGFDSLIFAVAIGYALVTMYDATGIRRAAGKTAACLNRMMDDFYKHDVKAVGGKLKELLGHTPLEVIIGALFGVLFAFYAHMYLTNHVVTFFD
jgi:acid phosphatase family membrane protein YuiD